MASKRATASTSKRRPRRRTTLAFAWRYAALKIVVTPDFLEQGWTQLELTVVTPKKAPIPLSSTGYYCHYLDAEQLTAVGGPVKLFTDRLDREARTRKWQETEFRWRQLDLFARGL